MSMVPASPAARTPSRAPIGNAAPLVAEPCKRGWPVPVALAGATTAKEVIVDRTPLGNVVVIKTKLLTEALLAPGV